MSIFVTVGAAGCSVYGLVVSFGVVFAQSSFFLRWRLLASTTVPSRGIALRAAFGRAQSYTFGLHLHVLAGSIQCGAHLRVLPDCVCKRVAFPIHSSRLVV